jgi:hypothetical protein
LARKAQAVGQQRIVKPGEINPVKPTITKPSLGSSGAKASKEEQEVANLPDNVGKQSEKQKPTASDLL